MKAMVLIAMSVLCTLPMFGAAFTLDQNAILNPGAEAGSGSATGDDIIAAPSWASTGSFTVVNYGASDAPLPAGVPGFGNNFFSGGPGSATSTGTQTIDVSNFASAIDAHGLRFVLSGYFGGYLTQPDNATLYATFIDGLGNAISTKQTGGITAAERNQQTVLVYDSKTGLIPVGTRSVVITLEMDRLQYSYNDGYADNVSFVASAVPEPGTWTMLLLGCVLVGLRKAPLRTAR